MSKKTNISECIRNMHEHSASLLLMLLLCADLAFFAFHAINTMTPFLNDLFSLEKDRGYPEMYQYLKWFWIIIVLAYISILRRSFCYIAWGLVFTYFLCDDVLRIHETTGGNIGRYIGGNLNITPPFGLGLRDLGQLVAAPAWGMILLPPVAWAYLQGSQAFKKMSQDMLLLILALGFFGVFVDAAHVAIQLGYRVNFILGVIEDGGEMLVASLMLWYVFLLSVRDESATSYLYDFVRVVLTKRST